MSDETREDGGPAFPIEGHAGMSLRDYFAAKAMHAEIVSTFSDATPESAEAFVRGASEAGHTPEQHLAVNAYRVADAMLKQRGTP